MHEDTKFRIRCIIDELAGELRKFDSPSDLYAHTQITEALNALRMLDVTPEHPQ